MTPRPYQFEALAKIESGLARIDRGLVVQPTRTGKTIVMALLIDQWRKAGVIRPGRPAIVVAHTDELIQQAAQKIALFDDWLRIGIEKAESRADASCEVIVASVQTIGRKGSNRLGWAKPPLVIYDESHHAANARTYWEPAERFGCFDGRCKLLGFTATPGRLDRVELVGKQSILQEVLYEYPIRQAWKDGYVLSPRGFRVRTATNLDAVGSLGGDFNEGQLAKTVNNTDRTMAAIGKWRELCPERQTIVFCCDIQHAKDAADLWRQAGFRAEAIHSSSKDHPISDTDRGAIVGRYRAGYTQILCNVGIAAEGFDDEATSCVVMLRPTQSETLFQQMSTRGCTIGEGKVDTIVIDCADLSTRHKLASLATGIGLPPDFDLEGFTLAEAIVRLDRVSGRALEVITGGKQSQPKTLREVDALIESVNLLDSVQAPPEVRKASNLKWTPVFGGGYVLDLGRVMISMRQDALGTWQMRTQSGPTSREFSTRREEFSEAVKRVDEYLAGSYGDLVKQYGRAKTSKYPASDKQKKFLGELGVDVSLYPGLSITEATSMISKLKYERAG